MRVLIVKTSALGDIVHTFPVIEYLRDRQQASTIGWVVESRVAALVRAHPFVDTTIEIDSKLLRSSLPSFGLINEWRRQRTIVRQDTWDLVFDLQGNCKSGLVTWCARSPVKVGYGRKSVAESPNIVATNHRYNPPRGLSIREEYLWIVQKYFHDTTPFHASPIELNISQMQRQLLQTEMAHWPVFSPIWIIAVGSNWPNKMCKTSSLLTVLRMIRAEFHPYFIFVAGSGEELAIVGNLGQEFLHSSHILYRPDLPLLQRAISNANAVIAVDSLILHLAATTKTPTFSFFGPSSATKYAPNGSVHGFFQSQCPNHSTFEKRCPFLRTCLSGECLKEADPTAMFQAIHEWQNRVSNSHRFLPSMHARHWCFHP